MAYILYNLFRGSLACSLFEFSSPCKESYMLTYLEGTGNKLKGNHKTKYRKSKDKRRNRNEVFFDTLTFVLHRSE